MGNTDKFEMIANNYDTAERIQIAKITSKAIREYLVETKDKALDTSQDMINQAKKNYLMIIYKMQIHYASILKKTGMSLSKIPSVWLIIGITALLYGWMQKIGYVLNWVILGVFIFIEKITQ